MISINAHCVFVPIIYISPNDREILNTKVGVVRVVWSHLIDIFHFIFCQKLLSQFFSKLNFGISSFKKGNFDICKRRICYWILAKTILSLTSYRRKFWYLSFCGDNMEMGDDRLDIYGARLLNSFIPNREGGQFLKCSFLNISFVGFEKSVRDDAPLLVRRQSPYEILSIYVSLYIAVPQKFIHPTTDLCS